MKARDNMSAVIEALQREHGLLAAYLEATEKIDWRALHKRVLVAETPKPVNVEAHRVSAAPACEGGRIPAGPVQLLTLCASTVRQERIFRHRLVARCSPQRTTPK